MGHRLKCNKIVKLALLFEVPLACPFLVYSWYHDSWDVFRLPSISQVSYAIFLSLILFCLNLFFYFIIYRFSFGLMINFIEGVVEPLASSLSISSAILVSVAAGIGEEFFFRGLLIPISGLVVSSICFALLHFISELRRFYVLCFIYTFIGMFFGLVYIETNSIWVVVMFHAIYDFLALLFFNSEFRFRLRANFQ